LLKANIGTQRTDDRKTRVDKKKSYMNSLPADITIDATLSIIRIPEIFATTSKPPLLMLLLHRIHSLAIAMFRK